MLKNGIDLGRQTKIGVYADYPKRWQHKGIVQLGSSFEMVEGFTLIHTEIFDSGKVVSVCFVFRGFM